MLVNKRTAGWVAAGAALAVGAGVAGVAVLRDDDSLAPGFVANGTTGKAMVHEAEVQLPIGTVRLSSGAPLDEIAARRVGEDGEGQLQAADDASVVAVSWSFEPSVSYDDLLSYPTSFSLALSAGGERVELGDKDVDLHEAADSGVLPGESLVAVVAGSGDDVAVAVTYEDEEQRADMTSGEVDAGRARALYPDGPMTWGAREPCDARRTDEARSIDAGASSIYCRIGPLTRTPYLPDLGWAEEDRVWSVVDVTVKAPSRITWLPTGTSYRVQRAPVVVSLSGGEEVRTPRTPADDRAAWTGTWVFDSPADGDVPALQVTAPLTAVRPEAGAAGPATIPFGVDQAFTFKR
jgi:hypothetical protein